MMNLWIKEFYRNYKLLSTITFGLFYGPFYKYDIYISDNALPAQEIVRMVIKRKNFR